MPSNWLQMHNAFCLTESTVSGLYFVIGDWLICENIREKEKHFGLKITKANFIYLNFNYCGLMIYAL